MKVALINALEKGSKYTDNMQLSLPVGIWLPAHLLKS